MMQPKIEVQMLYRNAYEILREPWVVAGIYKKRKTMGLADEQPPLILHRNEVKL